MRRAVLSWILALAVLAGAATGGVAILNATAFGPGAFVQVYLAALARGDTAGALAMPGVELPPDDRADLLVDETLTGLLVDGVTVDGGGDGIHFVTVAWRTRQGAGTSTFTVAAAPALGMLARWEFAVSPVASLDLTVAHDDRFDVADVSVRAGGGGERFAVLVPGVYRVDHHSTFLRADAVDVVADRPGATIRATLDVQPTQAFVDEVTAQVHAQLDACATQQVLFPAGCPIGRAISNRVVSPPEWSIVDPPEVDLVPGDEPRSWRVPPTVITANLRVDVQSLFDGTITTFDEDVRSTASYLVRILPDDATLRIELLPE